MYIPVLFLFQFDNGIGDGSSLIYPEEIVDAIRKLYPGDVKNYTPRSRKVTRQLKYVVRKPTFWKETLYVKCISFLAAEELL